MGVYIIFGLILIVSIIFLRNYYIRNKEHFKNNGISPMPKDKYSVLLFPAILPIFLAIMISGFSLFDVGENDNKGNSSSTSTVSPVQDDGKCSRCYGTKKVATYSQTTCDASHFKYGDCIGGHIDEYDCFSIGSKTCPCCKGSGRKS